MAHCLICKKGVSAGSNISHSKVHTKRQFKANLQKVNGVILCTKCLKTIKTNLRNEQAYAAQTVAPAETAEVESVK
ncbi:MAG: bL28 family ribosomal protein [Candidatus Berkelbacteria bacterium]